MRTKQKIPMILLLVLLAVMVGIGIWNYCIYHSEYGFAREVSEEEQIRLLATDGMLVKRPLLVNGDFVLVGFKEIEWEKINNA